MSVRFPVVTTVPVASGSVIVLSATVGSVIVNVVSNASVVAPSKTIAFSACISTVSTVVVVPFTVRLGTLRVPVLGL